MLSPQFNNSKAFRPIAKPLASLLTQFRKPMTTIEKLARSESIANAHLKNPAKQAELYKQLLDSKYPQLVVNRFETPGVARDLNTERLYADALKMLGSAQSPKGSTIASKQSAVNSMGTAGTGTGAGGKKILQTLFPNHGTDKAPLHVVVSESYWTIIFRWIKWLVPMGLASYLVLAIVNLLNDSAVSLKGLGSPPEVAGSKIEAANGEQSNVKFSDVLGVDEAKNELVELVDFLQDPSKFTGLGGKLPKGVLLTGPPGTGKTMLAKAVAGEAGVPFFFMSGSEFDELYVGVGAKRVRELFQAARKAAPAIIFIDELDAIGGKRNPKDQSYSRQTLNQLLVDLDGFSALENVVVMGATNFPEMLDQALTRPGRFDKIVQVDLPDVRGRSAILNHYLEKVECEPKIDAMSLARGTPGFSGADLQNLVNQAAVRAGSLKAPKVDFNHLDWAKDKILLGAARTSMVMTEETRRNTAFHEAGHAIVALYTKGATPLYKATVLPRGGALGITFQLPELDKYDETKQELLARLDVCMGGKIAEEMLRGGDQVTSGCSSDLRQATSLARAMVASYGMSDVIGPVSLENRWSDWSAHTKHLVEEEIRSLLIASEQRTRKLLNSRSRELSKLAEGLITYETLDKNEIELVVKGKKPLREPMTTNKVLSANDIRDPRATV